jgi:hypothetical protein
LTIVTEDILAPYRSDGRSVDIWVNTRLPPTLFTSTERAFQTDWANPDIPNEELAIVLLLAFTRCVPVLKPGRDWLALDHQCGGHACQHFAMVATRLNPRPSVVSSLRKIAREDMAQNAAISIRRYSLHA